MVKKEFVARHGAPFKKGDVKDIGLFIDNIPERTTENILMKIEKSKNHIIHSYIEWDDTIASHKYRLQQVRNIVNHIEVNIKHKGEWAPIRAFFSIQEEIDGDDSDHYIPIEIALSDVCYRKKIIDRAYTELENWRDRYNTYIELTDIISALSPFIGKKKVPASTVRIG